MVGPTLQALTDTTVTDLDVFVTKIHMVRRRGFAVCRGEDVTYSNGASAAIRLNGRPVAAIDLWGPDRLVPQTRLHALGKAAAAGAAQLEHALTMGRPRGLRDSRRSDLGRVFCPAP